jgi:hypothetical protein
MSRIKFMSHVHVCQVNVSTWTLVAICLDRYNAIIHPLATRQSKSRARSVQWTGQFRGWVSSGTGVS